MNRIIHLSADVRAELDKRLIESGYTRFAEHAEWLKTKGADISKSAIHRYTADRWTRIVMSLQAAATTPIEQAEVRDLRVRALGVVSKDKPICRASFREADRVVAWAFGAMPSPELLEDDD